MPLGRGKLSKIWLVIWLNDHLVKATVEGDIRVIAAVTTNLVNEAHERHKTLPTASAALGRVLTAAVMMGATLKGKETVTIRVLGDGPAGAIIAVANAEGTVKGYIQNPQIHLPIRQPDKKLDVGAAVGTNGMLHVAKNLSIGESYTGSVPIVNGEIAADLAQYYLDSEQTPSAVSLGVLVETDNSIRAAAAGGYIIQLLPNAKQEIAQRLETNIQSLGDVSRIIDKGLDAEDLISQIFQGFNIKFHQQVNLDFRCDCSQDRLEEVLISLGPEEIRIMIEEQKGAEVTCHFCNKVYKFPENDLVRLHDEIRD